VTVFTAYSQHHRVECQDLSQTAILSRLATGIIRRLVEYTTWPTYKPDLVSLHTCFLWTPYSIIYLFINTLPDTWPQNYHEVEHHKTKTDDTPRTDWQLNSDIRADQTNCAIFYLRYIAVVTACYILYILTRSIVKTYCTRRRGLFRSCTRITSFDSTSYVTIDLITWCAE